MFSLYRKIEGALALTFKDGLLPESGAFPPPKALGFGEEKSSLF
jgi:hypothetical protein